MPAWWQQYLQIKSTPVKPSEDSQGPVGPGPAFTVLRVTPCIPRASQPCSVSLIWGWAKRSCEASSISGSSSLNAEIPFSPAVTPKGSAFPTSLQISCLRTAMWCVCVSCSAVPDSSLPRTSKHRGLLSLSRDLLTGETWVSLQTLAETPGSTTLQQPRPGR